MKPLPRWTTIRKNRTRTLFLSQFHTSSLAFIWCTKLHQSGTSKRPRQHPSAFTRGYVVSLAGYPPVLPLHRKRRQSSYPRLVPIRAWPARVYGQDLFATLAIGSQCLCLVPPVAEAKSTISVYEMRNCPGMSLLLSYVSGCFNNCHCLRWLKGLESQNI
jgi:hypothetical protein